MVSSYAFFDCPAAGGNHQVIQTFNLCIQNTPSQVSQALDFTFSTTVTFGEIILTANPFLLEQALESRIHGAGTQGYPLVAHISDVFHDDIPVAWTGCETEQDEESWFTEGYEVLDIF